MANGTTWHRHYAGWISAVYSVSFFFVIEYYIDMVQGGWRYALVMIIAMLLAFLLMFVRVLRRLSYAIMPWIWIAGFILTIVFAFIVPSNWFYLGLIFVVTPGYFMHVIYRTPY